MKRPTLMNLHEYHALHTSLTYDDDESFDRNHTRFTGEKLVMQRCSPKYVFITEHLSAHLNSYISEYSRKANNLSRDHTLVKIIAKLWDALYSFNYQPVSSGSFARHSRFLPILSVHLVSPDTCQLPSFLCVSLSFSLPFKFFPLFRSLLATSCFPFFCR